LDGLNPRSNQSPLGAEKGVERRTSKQQKERKKISLVTKPLGHKSDHKKNYFIGISAEAVHVSQSIVKMFGVILVGKDPNIQLGLRNFKDRGMGGLMEVIK